MEHKSLERIAIQELTDTAGVNRQTFYYHFADIYDLLKWTLQQEAIIHLHDKQLDELWQDGLLSFFKYLEGNRQFALDALHSLGYEHIKRFFYTEIHNIISDVIQQLGKDLPMSDEKYLQFLTYHYILSFTTLTMSWLEGEMDSTPEEIIEQIDITLQDQIAGGRLRLGHACTLNNRE